ncbi:hypothetical protein NLM27_21665 [Bradyrhizobium sp. CCGB12]|uniref:hypothetical protein n=1 Tax=Bradyrhizobium sp. CCGB12 TaxID=2949632 RepID=UPI0020B3BC99|nr:hypothetical protein [Bradyrhizobium sp. CCGB12]MCP3391398.1 hypothetical protein [Bradyrhizobium sp. CCGB12]
MTPGPTLWAIPALLALVTLLGLLAALIGEGGIWWALSWGMLIVPGALSLYYLARGLMPPRADP